MKKSKLREVYCKIGTEIVNGIPVEFFEFDDFWKTHKSDNDFVMIYLDENDKVVD